MIRAIAFDFDGVISPGGELLKLRAWDLLATTENEQFQKELIATRTALVDGKRNRFSVISATLSACGFSAESIPLATEQLAGRYNDIVQKLLFETGIPVSTHETLATLSSKLPLYINSATPENAVQESCERLGVRKFFKKIFGQPTGKVENLQRILATEHITPHELLFVGDSPIDVGAAHACGCSFIGIANASNNWSLKESFSTISSIEELYERIPLDTYPPI